MKSVICPGSFDPITNGHLDIIRRAALIFDNVIVAVITNSAKKPAFTIEERTGMVKKATSDIKNVKVCTFDGLLAEYAKDNDVCAIVKGLRAVSDFEYEFQMALVNKKLNKNLETFFLTANQKYTYLSSSIVKEISRNGGDIQDFVPPCVLNEIKERLCKER